MFFYCDLTWCRNPFPTGGDFDEKFNDRLMPLIPEEKTLTFRLKLSSDYHEFCKVY